MTTPRPTAGTSPSTRRTTGRAWRTSTAAATALAAQARRVLRHAGDGEVPRHLRRRHPRDARGARRPDGAVGHRATRSRTTSRTCTTTPGSRAKTQAKVREVLRRLYAGSEIGQGYPGDEDNGETVGLVPLQRARLLPAAGGQPDYAIGSPLFRARPWCICRTGGELVVNARGQQRATTSTCRGCGSTARRYDKAYLTPRPARARRARSSSRWARGRRAGARGAARAAVDHARRRASPHPMEDAARPDQGEGSTPRAVRRHRRPPRRLSRGRAFDFDAARRGGLLHAHLGRLRGRRSGLLGGRGLRTTGTAGRCSTGARGETFPFRSQTRPFQLRAARRLSSTTASVFGSSRAAGRGRAAVEARRSRPTRSRATRGDGDGARRRRLRRCA